MSITLDATTQAAYEAGTTAAQRAAAVVAGLTGTVTVKVFDGSDTEMGAGTMVAPWATASGATVTVGEVASFAVTQSGTPDAGWYLKISDGTHYVQGSFGLSGADFNWSLPSWASGQSGSLGTVTLTATGANEAPAFTVSPTSASLPSSGGTIQFEATDPNGDAVAYSLASRYSTAITINSATGLVTVPASLAGTSGNIVVNASDGTLDTDSAPCAVTVAAVGEFRWNPGHYIKAQGSYSDDQTAYWAQVFDDMDKALTFAPMKGVHVNVAWGSFNTTGSTYDWDDLDALFVRAATNSQKVIVQLNYKHFESSIGLLCPNDLEATDAYSVASGTKWVAAVWRSSVMARFIAAVQAFAARYDSHPCLELVTWSESSLAAAADLPADYSRSALSTRLQALMTAATAAFTQTYVLCNVNSLVGQVTQLMNNAFLAGGGFGTPDAVDTAGVKIFRGETVSGELPPTYGDLRTRMAHHEIVSAPVLGGKDDNGPATNIIDWAQTNKVTHLSWNTTVTIPGNTWADIQAAITADPLLHTARPTG